MSKAFDENELSTVEELDPEPASTRRITRTWELILGVALIAAVLQWSIPPLFLRSLALHLW